jgi:hypothetical protein
MLKVVTIVAWQKDHVIFFSDKMNDYLWMIINSWIVESIIDSD